MCGGGPHPKIATELKAELQAGHVVIVTTIPGYWVTAILNLWGLSFDMPAAALRGGFGQQEISHVNVEAPALEWDEL